MATGTLTRDRLSRALIDLCFERGYAELTVEDLCRRAGLQRVDYRARLR